MPNCPGLETLWRNGNEGTVDEGVAPLFEGTGDIVASPKMEEIEEKIGLLMGDLALAGREDELSTQWPKCLKPAHGAIGAHQQAVRDCYRDFRDLADELVGRLPGGCSLP
jgi:hypothetical protein